LFSNRANREPNQPINGDEWRPITSLVEVSLGRMVTAVFRLVPNICLGLSFIFYCAQINLHCYMHTLTYARSEHELHVLCSEWFVIIRSLNMPTVVLLQRYKIGQLLS